jgi:hypothetical protein
VHQSQQKLSQLSQEQEMGFVTAKRQLADVAASAEVEAELTRAVLLTSRQELEQAVTRLRELGAGQALLLSEIEQGRETLTELRNQQTASFAKASAHLTSIAEQSQAAEERLSYLLGEVTGGVERLTRMDASILGEVFKLASAFFYIGAAVLAYCATAHYTTARVRPLVFGLLALAFTLEHYLWDLAAYFPLQPSIAEYVNLLVAPLPRSRYISRIAHILPTGTSTCVGSFARASVLWALRWCWGPPHSTKITIISDTK